MPISIQFHDPQTVEGKIDTINKGLSYYGVLKVADRNGEEVTFFLNDPKVRRSLVKELLKIDEMLEDANALPKLSLVIGDSPGPALEEFHPLQ